MAFLSTPFWGLTLTFFAYGLASKAKGKIKTPLFNSLVAASALVILLLLFFQIPYELYSVGGDIISIFLGPVTVCLAVKIHAEWTLLKTNLLPILVGCLAGSLASLGSVFLLCNLFDLDVAMTQSLLPKSVTTPIATAISENHGGHVPITAAAVIVSGLLGSFSAPFLGKLFRSEDALETGLGIGACSHAIGTIRALEIGESEGAMSGLAIGLCGIFTAVAAVFF